LTSVQVQQGVDSRSKFVASLRPSGILESQSAKEFRLSMISDCGCSMNAQDCVV
jgi:hypothetical protein